MSLKDMFNGTSFGDSMKRQYVGSAIRAGLLSIGAVTAADVDNGEIAQLSGALIAILTVAWSMYQKYSARQLTVTALASAQMTENEAKARIADPAIQTPAVTTPADTIPTLTGA